MRSSVSVVMRPPLRSRLASLPSLTARRPKVEFGQAGLAAIVGDFLQQLLRVHGVLTHPGGPQSWRSVTTRDGAYPTADL